MVHVCFVCAGILTGSRFFCDRIFGTHELRTRRTSGSNERPLHHRTLPQVSRLQDPLRVWRRSPRGQRWNNPALHHQGGSRPHAGGRVRQVDQGHHLRHHLVELGGRSAKGEILDQVSSSSGGSDPTRTSNGQLVSVFSPNALPRGTRPKEG